MTPGSTAVNGGFTASDWGREIAEMGSQEGNHNQLEYFGLHIMPYVKEDVGSSSNLWGFETMEKLIKLAAKQTNYWNDYAKENENEGEHPLYNPHYEAQTNVLIEQLGSQFRTWEDVCFAVRMYLFAMM